MGTPTGRDFYPTTAEAALFSERFGTSRRRTSYTYRRAGRASSCEKGLDVSHRAGGASRGIRATTGIDAGDEIARGAASAETTSDASAGRFGQGTEAVEVGSRATRVRTRYGETHGFASEPSPSGYSRQKTFSSSSSAWPGKKVEQRAGRGTGPYLCRDSATPVTTKPSCWQRVPDFLPGTRIPLRGEVLEFRRLIMESRSRWLPRWPGMREASVAHQPILRCLCV